MFNERDNAIIGQSVRLQIQYYDVNGDVIEPDATPSLRIVDNNSNIILDYTDENVYKVGKGFYQIDYTVPSTATTGIWMDEWRAQIGGQDLDTVFVFTVVNAETGVEPGTGPGRIRIGDAVVFDFSDAEIYGINILLKYLKARLNSNGVKPKRDQFGAFILDAYGEVITEPCDIFSDEILVTFLCQALSEFNMIPFFTAYTFGDPVIQTLFSQAIVEGA